VIRKPAPCVDKNKIRKTTQPGINREEKDQDQERHGLTTYTGLPSESILSVSADHDAANLRI